MSAAGVIESSKPSLDINNKCLIASLQSIVCPLIKVPFLKNHTQRGLLISNIRLDPLRLFGLALSDNEQILLGEYSKELASSQFTQLFKIPMEAIPLLIPDSGNRCFREVSVSET